METDDFYKCPNCYNRVYEGQINCIKCGLQLRQGPRSFIQMLIHNAKYAVLGLIIFAIIIGIVISL